MADEPARQVGAAAGRAATIQLTAQKGSRLIPAFLLLAMTVVFVSNHFSAISGPDVGTVISSTTMPVAQKFAALLKGGTVGLFQSFSESFQTVASSTFYTIGVLSLYALLPGIAGLIYRRSFWRYFLAGFVILYTTAAVFGPRNSGVAGLISAGRPVAVSPTATGSAGQRSATTPAPGTAVSSAVPFPGIPLPAALSPKPLANRRTPAISRLARHRHRRIPSRPQEWRASSFSSCRNC